jgi:hypothetical protein
MAIQIKDAEAAVYAIESAVCFWTSVSSGNYLGACVEAIALAGWIKNTIA